VVKPQAATGGSATAAWGGACLCAALMKTSNHTGDEQIGTRLGRRSSIGRNVRRGQQIQQRNGRQYLRIQQGQGRLNLRIQQRTLLLDMRIQEARGAAIDASASMDASKGNPGTSMDASAGAPRSAAAAGASRSASTSSSTRARATSLRERTICFVLLSSLPTVSKQHAPAGDQVRTIATGDVSGETPPGHAALRTRAREDVVQDVLHVEHPSPW